MDLKFNAWSLFPQKKLVNMGNFSIRSIFAVTILTVEETASSKKASKTFLRLLAVAPYKFRQ